MELEEILSSSGFKLIEDTVLIYSNGKTTCSICKISKKSKRFLTEPLWWKSQHEWNNAERVIVSFQPIPEKDRIIIRTQEEFKNYYRL